MITGDGWNRIQPIEVAETQFYYIILYACVIEWKWTFRNKTSCLVSSEFNLFHDFQSF